MPDSTIVGMHRLLSCFCMQPYSCCWYYCFWFWYSHHHGSFQSAGAGMLFHLCRTLHIIPLPESRFPGLYSCMRVVLMLRVHIIQRWLPFYYCIQLLLPVPGCESCSDCDHVIYTLIGLISGYTYLNNLHHCHILFHYLHFFLYKLLQYSLLAYRLIFCSLKINQSFFSIASFVTFLFFSL